MGADNKKKSELLGEVFSSARGRLTRMILFQFVVETNKNICFQCGKKIEKLEDLSIEHKTPWMGAENPRETFYDLNNIAFSHILCNALSAGREIRARGEKNGRAKLTLIQVNEIRNKLEESSSCYGLAREYNISESNIRAIRDRKHWK